MAEKTVIEILEELHATKYRAGSTNIHAPYVIEKRTELIKTLKSTPEGREATPLTISSWLLTHGEAWHVLILSSVQVDSGIFRVEEPRDFSYEYMGKLEPTERLFEMHRHIYGYRRLCAAMYRLPLHDIVNDVLKLADTRNDRYAFEWMNFVLALDNGNVYTYYVATFLPLFNDGPETSELLHRLREQGDLNDELYLETRKVHGAMLALRGDLETARSIWTELGIRQNWVSGSAGCKPIRAALLYMEYPLNRITIDGWLPENADSWVPFSRSMLELAIAAMKREARSATDYLNCYRGLLDWRIYAWSMPWDVFECIAEATYDRGSPNYNLTVGYIVNFCVGNCQEYYSRSPRQHYLSDAVVRLACYHIDLDELQKSTISSGHASSMLARLARLFTRAGYCGKEPESKHLESIMLILIGKGALYNSEGQPCVEFMRDPVILAMRHPILKKITQALMTAAAADIGEGLLTDHQFNSLQELTARAVRRDANTKKGTATPMPLRDLAIRTLKRHPDPRTPPRLRLYHEKGSVAQDLTIKRPKTWE